MDASVPRGTYRAGTSNVRAMPEHAVLTRTSLASHAKPNLPIETLDGIVVLIGRGVCECVCVTKMENKSGSQ